jgi:hypothetical protein
MGTAGPEWAGPSDALSHQEDCDGCENDLYRHCLQLPIDSAAYLTIAAHFCGIIAEVRAA